MGRFKWDTGHMDPNFTVTPDGLTVSVNTASGLQGGVRTTLGKSTGKWKWAVRTTGPVDVGTTLGITTSALAKCPGLVPKGLAIATGTLYTYDVGLVAGAGPLLVYGVPGSNETLFQLDCDAGLLGIYNIDHQYGTGLAVPPLSIAFLAGLTIYPSVGQGFGAGLHNYDAELVGTAAGFTLPSDPSFIPLGAGGAGGGGFFAAI